MSFAGCHEKYTRLNTITGTLDMSTLWYLALQPCYDLEVVWSSMYLSFFANRSISFYPILGIWWFHVQFHLSILQISVRRVTSINSSLQVEPAVTVNSLRFPLEESGRLGIYSGRFVSYMDTFPHRRVLSELHVVTTYGFLWKSIYLLRKCDWGMMTGGLAVPSQTVDMDP